MKFLCEHCKAKYQIADEKVAGRTVRMKCRKCGNHIEVRAAVTETSVAAKPPEASEGAPRPSPARPPAPRAKPLATNLSHAAPARPSDRPADHGGALAGAFQRNVQRDDEAAAGAMDLRELSAADEWYVAVNGVPVGPVRVGEVRRKAAMGAVTEDSLCWQEGMEEWRTIRTVTELAAVVREAANGGRVSHLPEGPRPPTPPPARQRISTAPAAPAPRPPARAPLGPAPRANAVPFTSRMMTPDEEAGPTVVGRSPLLEDMSAEAHPAHTNGAPYGLAAAHAPDPFGAPAPARDPFMQPGAFAAAAPEPMPAAIAPPIVVAPPRKGGLSPFAILMIAMGCCFAITAAIVIFTRPAPQIVVAAPVASAPTAAQAATATAAQPQATSQPETAGNPAVADAGVKVASGGPRQPAGAGGSTGGAKPATPNATDPALRELIQGSTSGPSTGTSTSGGGGSQLSEEDVKRVVGRYQNAVKRTCWDRISTQTSSVNVVVHVNVGGTGQVSSASATGNDPVVAHCLEEEVRLWRFPGGGVAEIPFHFIRQ